MAFIACALSYTARRISPSTTATAFSLTAFTRPSATTARRHFRTTPSTSSSSSCSISALKAATLDTEILTTSLSVTHPAYDVLSKDVVSEFGAYCTHYRHKKSGAELLSVAVDDDNKVFGITFRTPPSDSTGVPHILEHSVLCGSRKYKTKDPFVQLLQGSLQTFLNAFTYPDRTCYVVASQNEKDFYNLVNVYTDAVFHPRAVSDPNVHAQEGWHLELETPDAPLVYKGVVYNEMKGVYSSPDSLMGRESQRSLFPDNTYSVDSGGDPSKIPDLSFDGFKKFHEKFYHPANARIYFSGDDDVLTRLELMDEYLSEFGPSPESKPGSVVQWQKKTYSEPKWIKEAYPSGADQPETHMVNINWLLHDKPMTLTEELTLEVLDHLMLGTSSSILRKALMESGLGSAITGGGISMELLQSTFSLGLKGVEKENVKAVETLILDTLIKVVEEGFTEDAIAASMNTMEFSMREFNTGSFPKGLSFMLGSMSKWIYDESPTASLKFEAPLAELKDSIATSGSKVFQDMVQTWLVDNTHRSIVEMVPSKTLEKEQLEEEQDRLAAIKSTLGEDDIKSIIDNTATLKALQAAEDTPEARATIPSLQLSDLKREVAEYPIEVSENESSSGVTVVRHELTSTSGIAYVDYAVDISGISVDDVPLLPLFTRLMTEAGAGEYDDVALSRRIGTYTGGLGVSLMLGPQRPDGVSQSSVIDGSHMLTKLFIRGKATADKTDELLSLYKLILTETRLDSKSKVQEMLKETRARIESSVQGSGHSFANVRMHARYSVGGYLEEKMSGLSYLNFIKDMQSKVDEDWPSVLGRLENMRAAILNDVTARNGMIVNLTGDKAVMDTIAPAVEDFLTSLPGNPNGEKLQDFYNTEHPWVAPIRAEMTGVVDEGFVVPTQVSYVGKGGQIFSPGEEVGGATAVVSRFLRTGYLWDNVRVIGGAYGGFCSFDSKDGFFSFLSYRDPNLASTLDVYDATADSLDKSATMLAEDEEALATAIIGTIGDMDSSLSPDQKGWTSLRRWMSRESAEKRQQFRDEILDTKPEDFKAFGDRLRGIKDPSVAVVSSKAAFEAAKEAGKEMKLVEVV